MQSIRIHGSPNRSKHRSPFHLHFTSPEWISLRSTVYSNYTVYCILCSYCRLCSYCNYTVYSILYTHRWARIEKIADNITKKMQLHSSWKSESAVPQLAYHSSYSRYSYLWKFSSREKSSIPKTHENNITVSPKIGTYTKTGYHMDIDFSSNHVVICTDIDSVVPAEFMQRENFTK